MAALELGEPQDFPFVDPPDTRQINDGYKLLQELKAVDEARVVTSLGRQISALPLDPRLARMLLAASHHRCVAEMLIIAAFLAAQDPRERPADAQAQADQKHAAFADPRSDFIAVLNLWKAFAEQSAALSGSQLRKWCRENFLSFMRMREWQELQRQLADIVAELQLKPNQLPADYNDLHQAILTGFLGNIGALDERREYEGARGTRFVIAPGTPLACEAAEVGRRREPHGDDASVCAHGRRSRAAVDRGGRRASHQAQLQRAALGRGARLRRRVRIDLAVRAHAVVATARELRQRRAGRSAADLRARSARRRTHAAARTVPRSQSATATRSGAAGSEAASQGRARRRADDRRTSICSVCRRHVHSIAALEKWLRGPHPTGALQMSRSDLMRRDVPEVTATSHPDKLQLAGNELPLEYVFEPGSARDGITVTLPLPLARDRNARRLRDADSGMAGGDDHGTAARAAEADSQGLRSGSRARRTRSGGDRCRPQGFPRSACEVDHALQRRSDDGRATRGAADAGRIALQHSCRRSERRGAGGRARPARAEARHSTRRERAIGRPAGLRASPLGFRRGARRSRSCSGAVCDSPSIRRCAITATVSSWRRRGVQRTRRSRCARPCCAWRCSRCPSSSSTRASDSPTTATSCCSGRV